MIYLSSVREWLKTLITAQHYYVGKLDKKPERAVGVYQRKNPAPPVRAIGSESTYEIKPISILIHWNKNADETEKAAMELYQHIRAASSMTIGDTQVYFIKLQSEPVDIGTDEAGIYERVIEFDIYFERNDT